MQLALATRATNQIENWHETIEPTPGNELQAKSFERDYPRATHRPTEVCFTYNCHGLTFAARRTEITSAAEILKILRDDGYVEVLRTSVMPGDIAIYTAANGDIDHSGIVIEGPVPGMLVAIPRVLSKWGSAHEVTGAARTHRNDVAAGAHHVPQRDPRGLCDTGQKPTMPRICRPVRHRSISVTGGNKNRTLFGWEVEIAPSMWTIP